MGISRVKVMGNAEGGYTTQSPVIVEPGKNSNSTSWLTNSYNLPEIQLNTPNQQPCKGLPDLTVPPPVIPPQQNPMLP